MSKYLLTGTYAADGARGLMAEGGSKRRAAATSAIESVGGSVESFYYAFGDTDVISIVDLPDDEAAAAVALIANASGGATVKTTVLLTPEQIDQAADRAVTYRPPGL